MVRVIMVAIGVWIFSAIDETLGILLMLPAIITVVVKLVKWLKDYLEDLARRRKEAKEEEAKRQKEIQDQQNAIREQQALIAHYVKSPSLKRALDTISGGCFPSSIPEVIAIYNDRIEGYLNEKLYTYSFKANREFDLPVVIHSVKNEQEIQYIVRPQYAIAQAINALLNYRYKIDDSANWRYSYHNYSDGESFRVITYHSKHVTMVLKSTLPNKYF